MHQPVVTLKGTDYGEQHATLFIHVGLSSMTCGLMYHSFQFAKRRCIGIVYELAEYSTGPGL